MSAERRAPIAMPRGNASGAAPDERPDWIGKDTFLLDGKRYALIAGTFSLEY